MKETSRRRSEVDKRAPSGVLGQAVCSGIRPAWRGCFGGRGSVFAAAVLPVEAVAVEDRGIEAWMAVDFESESGRACP